MKIQILDQVKEVDHTVIKAGLLLKELGIHANSVIIIKNDTLVCEDEMLREDDKIEIIRAISGG